MNFYLDGVISLKLKNYKVQLYYPMIILNKREAHIKIPGLAITIRKATFGIELMGFGFGISRFK